MHAGRYESGQQRPNPELQGERARPHLAKARRKLCESPSQLCKERTYLLASARCSAILPAGATLSTGLAAKESRGRTPRGRAGFAQQRSAPSRGWLTRPPRRLREFSSSRSHRKARLNGARFGECTELHRLAPRSLLHVCQERRVRKQPKYYHRSGSVFCYAV